eukprot:CAMPEP_0183504248 /NCGR_PEP_ID=MMETSP0371-20130417/5680_1 /TAXON_ID=268820 /ORGANISM="Peridinium aciculiferum, Strain PAER-2" /LENGTH=43 /DNA_ID= /DNA_START= /DNA_END= /DNA_ORIENTATION=
MEWGGARLRAAVSNALKKWNGLAFTRTCRMHLAAQARPGRCRC